MISPIRVSDGQVEIIDQSRLPLESIWLRIENGEDMAAAIREMRLRGAPLIGVAAAYGIVLAMDGFNGSDADIDEYYNRSERLLAATRPTAVNLFWALQRMREVFSGSRSLGISELRGKLRQCADQLYAEDIEVNHSIGVNGCALIENRGEVMTICNAGALATCGYGTALGVIRAAHSKGLIENVWVCETRPVLQGARLTAWELNEDGIPFTLITDNMAAQVMKNRPIAAVITGADRVAANGDSANKIGTLGLSILAAHFAVPFYVAAPLSTVDLNVLNGGEIVIEERSADEVRTIAGASITVPGCPVYNPAFDVTPFHQINAIITEKGIVRAPYQESLAALKNPGRAK